MSACPPLQVLEDAAAGRASAGAEISTHLAGCATCRHTVEDIRLNNSLLTQITSIRRASRLRRERPLAAPVVDDYEVLECVAQGGQGIVYRAIQKRTKRCVALKLLHGGHFATPRQRSRFDREVELAAGLHHPNIVTVHDSGITPDGRPFLSMEFIEGHPLDQWAKSCREFGTGFPPVKAIQLYRRLVGVLIKVCSALSYAHQRGVLHRDLKPGNILVDANDEPHIVDFGLAKLVDGDAAFNATQTGEFMGTIAYAAPEQVSSADTSADARSDVYALGVLLYEVLTGSLPYPVTGAIAEVVRQITTAEPSPPSRIDSSIPADLDTIALKAMTKDLNRRYQSARDLGEDLRRFLANEPILARSDSTWYLLRKTAHRYRRTLLFAATALMTLLMSLVAIGAYVIFNARADAARARALAELERADAQALVLHSASRPRAPDRHLHGYASRDLDRLEGQIRLGWLGDNRRREAATASLLARQYLNGGSAADAEELARQAVVQRLQELGPDNPEAAKSMHDLAEVLLVRNRLAEAIRYCDRSRAINRRFYGDDSIEDARDAELLARILVARGDSKAALPLVTNSIAIQSAKLGDETTELAQSLDTRSAALVAMGNREAAEADCLRSLRLGITLLQDENPAVVRSLRRMASILDHHTDNELGKAFVGVFGLPSPDKTGDRLRELAADLEQLNVPGSPASTSPLPILRRMLAVKEAMLGNEHKGLLSTLAAMAGETHVQSDFVQEERVLARSLSIIEKYFGAKSAATANCLEDWAGALINANRYEEGIKALQRSADIWWSFPADRRDDLKAAVVERALACYAALGGQYELAEQRAAHCIEAIRQVEGPEHHVIAHAQGIRAWALMHLGRLDEAEREAREAIALGERLRSYMPGGQLIQLPYYLGSILIAQGKIDDGEKFIQSAWTGDQTGDSRDGLRQRVAHYPLRIVLVEDMIKVCMARKDADCEARWRKELPPRDRQSVSTVND